MSLFLPIEVILKLRNRHFVSISLSLFTTWKRCVFTKMRRRKRSDIDADKPTWSNFTNSNTT